MMKSLGESASAKVVHIRRAKRSDMPEMVKIDEEISGMEKRGYWKDIFVRGRGNSRSPRFLLVAEAENHIQGFIFGEIRAWEFGEPPCGWVFAIQIRPKMRLQGIGTHLFAALCDAFRHAGVTKVRTIMARDNHLVLSFFRSQGLMAGPFIELEMTFDENV